MTLQQTPIQTTTTFALVLILSPRPSLAVGKTKCRQDCPILSAGMADLSAKDKYEYNDQLSAIIYPSNEGPFEACNVHIQKHAGPIGRPVLWDFHHSKDRGGLFDTSHHQLSGMIPHPITNGQCAARCLDDIPHASPIFGAKLTIHAYRSMIRYQVECRARPELLAPSPTPVGGGVGGGGWAFDSVDGSLGSLSIEAVVGIGTGLLVACMLLCCIVWIVVMRAGRKAALAESLKGDMTLDGDNPTPLVSHYSLANDEIVSEQRLMRPSTMTRTPSQPSSAGKRISASPARRGKKSPARKLFRTQPTVVRSQSGEGHFDSWEETPVVQDKEQDGGTNDLSLSDAMAFV